MYFNKARRPRFEINWTRPPRWRSPDVNFDELFGDWIPQRAPLEPFQNAAPGTPRWIANQWIATQRMNNDEQVLPGNPAVGGERRPWQSIRPPGWHKPPTSTEAGETVTPDGLVLLEPPVGYTPSAFRYAETRSLGQRPLASWDRTAPLNVNPQQIIQEIDAARNYSATGGNRGGGDGLDVYTGVPTRDEVWEAALLPLMSNRAFNDVMMESVDLDRALQRPGISRDEGTMAAQYGALSTLAQNAMAAALADAMNREAENREYQSSLLDLSNQYGTALADLYQSMMPDWTEWIRALLAGRPLL